MKAMVLQADLQDTGSELHAHKHMFQNHLLSSQYLLGSGPGSGESDTNETDMASALTWLRVEEGKAMALVKITRGATAEACP